MKVSPHTRLLNAIAHLATAERLAALASYEERVAIMVVDGGAKEADASAQAAEGVAGAFGVVLRREDGDG